MNIRNFLSAVFLTAMSVPLVAMERPNFDLVNAYPKRPVYYKINNEPWQLLTQGHIARHIAASDTMHLTLSAYVNGSHPTYFDFTPQIPEARSAQQRTCYIQVDIKIPSMEVVIREQNAAPGSSQTKFGLPLTSNIKNQALTRQSQEQERIRRATQFLSSITFPDQAAQK